MIIFGRRKRKIAAAVAERMINGEPRGWLWWGELNGFETEISGLWEDEQMIREREWGKSMSELDRQVRDRALGG